MKQYFVRYKYEKEKRSYNENIFRVKVEDSCIYKSNKSPQEFFKDLKKYVSIDVAVNPETVNIIDLKCLGDFQTIEEKKIDEEKVWEMRKEMHESLR